jgi:hypothetical protein
MLRTNADADNARAALERNGSVLGTAASDLAKETSRAEK